MGGRGDHRPVRAVSPASFIVADWSIWSAFLRGPFAPATCVPTSLACVRGPGNVCARKPAPHLHLVPPPCPTCDGSGEVEAEGDVPELAVERALCPDCFPEGT